MRDLERGKQQIRRDAQRLTLTSSWNLHWLSEDGQPVARLIYFVAIKQDRENTRLFEDLVQSRLILNSAGECQVNGTGGPSGLRTLFWRVVPRPWEAGLGGLSVLWVSGHG